MALEFYPEGGRHSSKGQKIKRSNSLVPNMARRQSPFKPNSDTQPSYGTPHGHMGMQWLLKKLVALEDINLKIPTQKEGGDTPTHPTTPQAFLNHCH